MDSLDNFRERFEALEQQTEQLKHQPQALEAHTRTVERQLRWWHITGHVAAVAALGLTLALSLPVQAVLAASDQFTVIDVPGSTFTEARGINERGQIVGDYDAGRHGFLLSKGTFTTIDSPACPVPFPRGSQIVVYGINNRGQAVGNYNPCGTESHGFLWMEGTLTRIDAPGSIFSTEAHGINERGQMVGCSDDPSGKFAGFLLSGGTFTSVPGCPYGINNHGQIAGNIAGPTGLSGFLLSGGTLTLIHVPDSIETEVRGINERGQMVGFYFDADGTGHGFLFSDGTFTTLHGPGGIDIAGGGLNNQGEIVGGYIDASGVGHGFELRLRAD